MQKHSHMPRKMARSWLAHDLAIVPAVVLAINQIASTERAWQESLAGLVVVVPLIERERVDFLVSGKSETIVFFNATKANRRWSDLRRQLDLLEGNVMVLTKK